MAQRAEDEDKEAGVHAEAGATLEQAPAKGQPQPQPSTPSDSQDVFSRLFDVFSYARHRAGRLRELQQQVDACKFVPFSVGQRLCPGIRLAEAQIHVLLVQLLRRLRWEPNVLWGTVDLEESYSLTLLPAQIQSLRFVKN